jgi:hypothetical protein
MKSLQITPGLRLNEDMYGVVRWQGLARHAPHLGPLTWQRFTNPARWWLIPGRDGSLSRAEMTLRETPNETVKVNIWFMPDLPPHSRRHKPRPHSHPWDFRSHILLGAYYEDRYTLADRCVRSSHDECHREGETSRMSRAEYHEVVGVWDPGRTISLMICGPGERGTWGHLDLDKGIHMPARRDPYFTAKLEALNPHRR